MDRDLALTRIEAEAGRFLELATAGGADLSAPVPSCPDWDLARLVLHLGDVYNWVGTIVGGALLEPPADLPRRPEGIDPPDWTADRLTRLLTALRDSPDDALMWNLGPERPSSAAFWRRRQLHETAIHRADAELTAGVPVSPLDPDIAADTVSEVFTIFGFADVTDDGAGTPPPPPAGPDTPPASVHLHATDVGGAEWTLDTAARTIARRHAKGDVAIRGTAWALARWCWGRPVDGEIEAFGDLAAAEAWRSTVVP